jgi:hypothetical protein
MKRVTLSASLQKRIIKDVRQGIPPQVAAVKAGVPLERFLDWVSRPGRKYKTLALQIEQAHAVATAENVLLLKRAAKKGKFKAAVTWLQSQAPQHFPSSRGISIGTLNANSTIIAQIRALQAEIAEAEDPRDVLLREMEQQQTAMPAPREERPQVEAYEPNVVSDREPNVIEMIATLPAL